jgi:hypothetical protein
MAMKSAVSTPTERAASAPVVAAYATKATGLRRGRYPIAPDVSAATVAAQMKAPHKMSDAFTDVATTTATATGSSGNATKQTRMRPRVRTPEPWPAHYEVARGSRAYTSPSRTRQVGSLRLSGALESYVCAIRSSRSFSVWTFLGISLCTLLLTKSGKSNLPIP